MLPEETYEAARRIAEEKGERLSDVLRDAVQRYVNSSMPGRTFTFIGKGRSRRGDISQRSEELLGELLKADHDRWRSS